MQTVLVTGATGFLGGAVARHLHRHGIGVRGTGRNRDAGLALQASGIGFERRDLGEGSEELLTLVQGCAAVVHCAALSAPWGRATAFERANVTATRRLVEACERSGVSRLVHISSPSVAMQLRHRRDVPEGEPWTTPAMSPYVATKREAEAHVLSAAGRSMDVIVLRPRALFGPGDTTLLPRVIRVARTGRFPLFGDREPLLDLTWIEDAATAVRLALESPRYRQGRIYNVTSGDPQPRRRILETIFDSCGLAVRFRRFETRSALRLAGALEAISRTLTRGRWEPPLTRQGVAALGFAQTLDISAARRELGYHPDTDVLARLAETGRSWRTVHSPGGAAQDGAPMGQGGE